MIEKRPINILLLTNRDSDNVGDQVIEACDISLVETVMKNLGISDSEYVINSRAAAIVPKKYLKTRDVDYLKGAEKTIKDSDLIIFGGAPLFNYLYQDFYERTAVTLEFAEKYNVPVIFSAIGIESYHEDNEKCQRLKETLNFNCVKQITTRDGFEFLEKYIENENIKIAKVSDPAVFSKLVFKNFISEKSQKKKIGLFIIRRNAFKDNGYRFTSVDAAKMWLDIIEELKSRGFDYEVITSGHFGDEAFVDNIIRESNLSEAKCVFNINSPEDLIPKISSYDAIVSCRLHPSIISFSFEVPSLGLIWNNKVEKFYKSFGYGDRAISVENIDVKALVDKVEAIITEGVTQNKDELITVYTSLFSGIKSVLKPEEEIDAFTYDELVTKMAPYNSVTEAEKNDKLKRKFRRTYNSYNTLFIKTRNNQQEFESLQKLLRETYKEYDITKKTLKATEMELEKTKKQLEKFQRLSERSLIRIFASRVKRFLKRVLK